MSSLFLQSMRPPKVQSTLWKRERKNKTNWTSDESFAVWTIIFVVCRCQENKFQVWPILA